MVAQVRRAGLLWDKITLPAGEPLREQTVCAVQFISAVVATDQAHCEGPGLKLAQAPAFSKVFHVISRECACSYIKQGSPSLNLSDTPPRQTT